MGRLKKDFFFIFKNMGFANACKLVLYPRICQKFGERHAFNKAIDKFITNNFNNIVLKYSNTNLPNKTNIPNIIWVFWWQGKSSMPEVIRQCYLSICRNSNGRNVFLLDKTNIDKYINLPNIFLEKLQCGKIGLTHFSDIIRVELLKKWGGLWIDAGIFVTKPIPLHQSLFFSPRLCIVPQDTPHMNQWVIGVMEAPPNMPLFNYISDILNAYWKKFDAVFHYLMFDYLIRYGYEHFTWVKELIKNRPIESPDLHFSRYTFNQEVNEKTFNKLIKDNTFLSLTYRISYPNKSKKGNNTYYSALIKKYNKTHNF